MNNMTLKGAMIALRACGLTLRHDANFGEYRVNFKGGQEETAYYTNSLVDAVSTGHNMILRRGN